MDDIERLAARANMEIRTARDQLTDTLLESLSATYASDRQFQAVHRMVTMRIFKAMVRLNAGIWMWAESLRQYNGQVPSEYVDDNLPIPEWDPDWEPDID